MYNQFSFENLDTNFYSNRFPCTKRTDLTMKLEQRKSWKEKKNKKTFRTFLGFMSSLNFFRCNSSKFLTVHELCLLFLARVKISTHVLYINVSYVMEFLAWWVLKNRVFAQKSTVVKWNCCILWIDIAPGPQKVPKLYFQSQFSVSKINQIFSKKNFI